MKDYTLSIPRGCSCNNVEIGSYANQVELPTPAHMLALGSLGCITFRPTTCIDRCIAPLIQALWERGVVTLGCCCGHNKLPGMVNIWQPSAARVEATRAAFETSPINPRTGQPWRLTDAEVAPYVDARQREVCSSPETARAFLIAGGFLNPDGTTPEEYGGTAAAPTAAVEVQQVERLTDDLVGRLRSLRVVLGIDSPETRGWAPAVQQEARRVVDAAIAALQGARK